MIFPDLSAGYFAVLALRAAINRFACFFLIFIKDISPSWQMCHYPKSHAFTAGIYLHPAVPFFQCAVCTGKFFRNIGFQTVNLTGVVCFKVSACATCTSRSIFSALMYGLPAWQKIADLHVGQCGIITSSHALTGDYWSWSADELLYCQNLPHMHIKSHSPSHAGISFCFVILVSLS